MLQAGSTLVDPYSATSAAVTALYGPLHGGANEAVIRMLMAIGSPENVPDYLERVKRKEVVLSGFGHRVYRTTDPRSKIIRQTADEVFAVTGEGPLLKTAIALHKAASADDYFVSRKLGANVDCEWVFALRCLQRGLTTVTCRSLEVSTRRLKSPGM